MFTLDHVNINVTDIEKSVAFYAQAFGLKEFRRKVADDGRYTIVFMEDGTTGFGLELTWLRDKQGAYNLGDNESHIGFATDDFETSYNHHKQMGIICYENTAMGVYFIIDPDGYWQEIKRKR